MISSYVCQSCRARLWRRQQYLRRPQYVRHNSSVRFVSAKLHSRNLEEDDQPKSAAPGSLFYDDIFKRYRNDNNVSGRYSRYLGRTIESREETEDVGEGGASTEPLRISPTGAKEQRQESSGLEPTSYLGDSVDAPNEGRGGRHQSRKFTRHTPESEDDPKVNESKNNAQPHPHRYMENGELNAIEDNSRLEDSPVVTHSPVNLEARLRPYLHGKSRTRLTVVFDNGKVELREEFNDEGLRQSLGIPSTHANGKATHMEDSQASENSNRIINKLPSGSDVSQERATSAKLSDQRDVSTSNPQQLENFVPEGEEVRKSQDVDGVESSGQWGLGQSSWGSTAPGIQSTMNPSTTKLGAPVGPRDTREGLENDLNSPPLDPSDLWLGPLKTARTPTLKTKSPPGSRKGKVVPTSLGPAAQLTRMSEEGATAKELWRFFEKHFTSPNCTALQTPSFSDINIIREGKIFQDLTWYVLKLWWKTSRQCPTGVPQPHSVIAKMRSLSLLQDWTIPFMLLEGSRWLVGQSSSQHQKDPEILLSFMEAWKYFLFTTKGSTPATTSPADWSFLPETTLHGPAGNSMGGRIRTLFPSMPQNGHIATAAAVTWCLLVHERGEFGLSESQVESCWPFVVFFSGILATGDHELTKRAAISHIQRPPLSEPLRLKWADMIENIQIEAAIINGEQRVLDFGERTVAPEKSTTKPSHALEATIVAVQDRHVKSLARAVESQRLLQAQQLWQKTQTLFDRASGKSESPIPLKVYNAFLKGFMQLQYPEGTTEVWNTMIRNGVEPGDTTWTSVLYGCHALRDADALESFWQRMIKYGHQPTERNWTARIHGLMTMNRRTQGLQLLDEMGQAWRASSEALAKHKAAVAAGKKRKNETAPVVTTAPTIEMVNAAMNGMSRAVARGRADWSSFERLREWAQAYDLKPNIYTYNPMIRAALHMTTQGKAFELLDEMAKLNIEPDAATYHAIIRDMFRTRFAETDTSEETQRNVKAMLADLATQKKLNKYVYTALVEALVRRKHDSAIQIVLRSIVDAKLMMPSSVMTVLARYYFDREEPDLYAAEELWNKALVGTTGASATTDVIFFDRMIEGWARAGRDDKMRTALLRMGNLGMRPGWVALLAVMQCYQRMGNYRAMAEVKRDVLKGGGALVPQVRAGIHGRDAFWDFTNQFDLSEFDDVAAVDNAGEAKTDHEGGIAHNHQEDK